MHKRHESEPSAFRNAQVWHNQPESAGCALRELLHTLQAARAVSLSAVQNGQRWRGRPSERAGAAHSATEAAAATLLVTGRPAPHKAHPTAAAAFANVHEGHTQAALPPPAASRALRTSTPVSMQCMHTSADSAMFALQRGHVQRAREELGPALAASSPVVASCARSRADAAPCERRRSEHAEHMSCVPLLR